MYIVKIGGPSLGRKTARDAVLAALTNLDLEYTEAMVTSLALKLSIQGTIEIEKGSIVATIGLG